MLRIHALHEEAIVELTAGETKRLRPELFRAGVVRIAPVEVPAKDDGREVDSELR
jgi:hypothetical protein